MKKIALITGGSRGLGYRIAEKFVQQGHDVLIVARNRETLEQASHKLSGAYPGSAVHYFAADIGQPEDITSLVKHIEQSQFAVDPLVNNAGIYSYKPFLETTAKEIQATLNLNLTGLILLTRELLPLMIAGGGGRIIHIASDVAKRPLENMSPYVATKYGLLGFSRSIAKEFRDRRIYSSVICPGMINNNELAEDGIDWGMLSPTRLAEIVYFVYQQSDKINFDEVEIHPLMQNY